MHFLANYGLFLLKVITIVLAILAVIVGIFAMAGKGKVKHKDKLEIKKLNDKYKNYKHTLQEATLDKHALKQSLKQENEEAKEHAKQIRKKMYVINFHGDIKASAVKNLREEITSILEIATPKDEVVINIESSGGMVHTYGLAASQLVRVRQKNIPLTVTIDKVAASGGYLMASVADKIIAAPFAIVGSIGVIAQLPNFHRWLNKNDIDFEQFMAGEYKRTVTIFGKNTDKGRQKLQEEIEEVHSLFKGFVTEYRPIIDIHQVATGKHWYGARALKLKLVDELITSDDYLMTASKNTDIYQVAYCIKKTLGEKLGFLTQSLFANLVEPMQFKHNKFL
jgi:serine protease SohB